MFIKIFANAFRKFRTKGLQPIIIPINPRDYLGKCSRQRLFFILYNFSLCNCKKIKKFGNLLQKYFLLYIYGNIMMINNSVLFPISDFKYINSDEKKEETTSQDEISVFDNTETNDEIRLIAHRGDNNAPENTIPAFEKAAEHGYDTVECDVSWTKDNIPVLLHDSTINRTARTKLGFKLFFPKYCSDMTYDKLKKYDFGAWFSQEYKDTKIPTFNELLDCSKESNLDLYVEIKECSSFDEERAKILMDTIKEYGIEDKITFVSFDKNYLEIIKNLMPEARLGYLSRNEIQDETIEILDNLKTDTNDVFLDIKYTKITDDGIKNLNDAGYDFEAWTVEDINTAEKLADMNCKGITTDSLTKEEINSAFLYNG